MKRVMFYHNLFLTKNTSCQGILLDEMCRICYNVPMLSEKMYDYVKLNLLFDFYGELLTNNQREIISMYVNENLTFTEIAEIKEVSRQSVFDTVKRSEKILMSYEDKLNLLEKFQNIKKNVSSVMDKLHTLDIDESSKNELMKMISELIDEI